ncbi:PEP-CTERM sorting domain-containing protein [Lacipirellula parvula]|uniref:Uncharacterized protein n=1 Tax=Lacipirellula parvula TaxID=2650471 RepID=A0A5K7XJ93_9BACT|nr:PEP-CTERM sorting domain-containing protein [Lacipirellula parvula]BBO36167.1 hypothetical protein PLANPX_5779 [Lacipirellula parvula]
MKLNLKLTAAALSLLAACPAAPAFAADPWADKMVEYIQGTGVGNDFVTGNPINNPQTALGEPTRFASDPANFGGPTTPFSSAYRDHEIVSIGIGGSLTLQFDEPVQNHPLNPYGIDLLIFGNSFYELVFGPNTATGSASIGGGQIEVSANGVDFVPVSGVADGLFPTVGYLDVTEAFPSQHGQVLSDFTKPVNPAALTNVAGMTTAQIIAAYDGSGGGVGVDIASTGLASISYVRITNPLTATNTVEIDAMADVRAVPEPATIALGALAACALWSVRRRQR